MALQTVNQFDIGTRFSNLGTGFAQGQQFGLARQAGQRAQAQEQRAVTADDQAQSELRRGTINELAVNISKLPLGQRAAALEQSSDRLRSVNIDPSVFSNTELTDSVLSEIIAGTGGTAAGPSALDQARTAKLRADIESGPSAVIGTASQRDFKTFQDLKKTDPEKARVFGLQSGFIPKTDEAQAKADIAVDKAARKEVAKANTKRVQGFIDSGIEAADTAGDVKRSIELLETVETGGIDAALLRAKQLFGIEGADEAELSTNLGKNVLAQLKPIFGAAFTVKEGEELKRIEAGFGKSTAGNIRLLKRTLKIADRAARRGIAAAKDQGDAFTENEIRSSLEFKVDEEPETPALQAAPDVQEGQVIINRQTGQRMRLVNGQFVEVQ